jgi:hypothetical protein
VPERVITIVTGDVHCDQNDQQTLVLAVVEDDLSVSDAA